MLHCSHRIVEEKRYTASRASFLVWLYFFRTLPSAIMSSHKRKRTGSLHDTPVDLTKMQLAIQRLGALKEELSGFEETTDEIEQIMTHVDALEVILNTTKKLVRDTSTPRSLLAITACRNSDFQMYRRMTYLIWESSESY